MVRHDYDVAYGRAPQEPTAKPKQPVVVITDAPLPSPFRQASVSPRAIATASRAGAFLKSARGLELLGLAPIDTLFIEGRPPPGVKRRLSPGSVGQYYGGTHNVALSAYAGAIETAIKQPVIQDVLTHEEGHNLAGLQGRKFIRKTGELYRQFLKETGLEPGQQYDYNDPRYASRNPLEFEAATFRKAFALLHSPHKERVEQIISELRKDKSSQAQATLRWVDLIRARNRK